MVLINDLTAILVVVVQLVAATRFYNFRYDTMCFYWIWFSHYFHYKITYTNYQVISYGIGNIGPLLVVRVWVAVIL